MNTKKVINRISQENLLKLSRWVITNKDILEEKNINDLAFDASKDLGFSVIRSHLRTCAAALDLPIGSGRGTASDPAKRGDAARTIAQCLRDLLAQLGMPENDAINRVATR